MEQYITELSKYFITLFMALYTYECFAIFRYDNEVKRRGIYIRQYLLMFAIHFTCYLSICLKSGKIEYIFFFAFQQIALFTTIVLFHMIYPKSNRLLVNNMCMLLSIGFVILTRISYKKSIKQFIIVAISLGLGLAVPYFVQKLKYSKKGTLFYVFSGILSLLLVFLFGTAINGSKISFQMLGIFFQPSEFVKILFVFCIASLLTKADKFSAVCLSALVAGAHIFILVLSRDLGSALIFFVTYIIMLFIATQKWIYLLLGIVSGTASAMIAYQLFSHVRVRVEAWIDPWSSIENNGYQIAHSLFAIGCGNWFGLGIYQGTPSSIPYVETDFIFAAIAEELGVIFALCLILVCISCFIMFMNIAIRLQNKFYQLLAMGIGITYIFQIFMTIGGGTKFIPLTGVTLPLLSYGGSSVLSTILMFAVIEGLYILHTKEGVQKPNKEIMFITYFFVVLFLGLMAYLIYFTATNEEKLINNNYNPRQEMLSSENTRGTIFASKGEVLAESVQTKDGKEMRHYPLKELMAHCVGYSTKGKTGIELEANYYLINSNISFSEKIKNDTLGVKNLGDNVYTSLDVNLQKVASEALGVYKGAIVVMKPRTGEILAMVSKPTFDPNELAFIWEDVIKDTESSVLVNRVTQGMYPPGSTFKIVTVLEYMRQNPQTYQNYKYQCNGKFVQGEHTINCYHGSKHGEVNLEESFSKSCNASFANMGVSLEKESFSKTLESLLFGKKLGLKMNYNKSPINITKDSTMEELIQSVIGQGKMQMTPMHLALITSAIANQGIVMTPYMVERVESANGTVIKQFQPEEYQTIITPQEANVLAQWMERVVQTGTGKKLSGLSYRTAGKTGSAEYNNIKKESHAWFTGFAPVEHPEIVVTIIIEGAGSGSDYAVPVAKRIFDAYFKF